MRNWLAVLLVLGGLATAGAQEHSARLGDIKRGGRVSFEPTGPGVLFAALAPVVRKWYVPQELYAEYGWRQREYSNYARSNYQSYCVRIAEDAPYCRDRLMQGLLDRSISSRRGIMTIHREPAYASLCGAVELPATERASDETLLLPLYPQMTEEEQDSVIRAVVELERVA